jgi:hypothetical protein
VILPNTAWATPQNLITSKSFTDPKDTTGAPTGIGDIAENNITEEQLTATVFAALLAPDTNRERQRTVTVPYAVSNTQLTEYGDRFNKFLSGRSLGWQFAGAIAAINPFSQIAVTHKNLIYYLKADAIQYAINLTQAYVLFNGIECGTAATSSPSDISRPVTVSFGSAIATDDSFTSTLNRTLALITASDDSFSASYYLITPEIISMADTSNATGLNLTFPLALADDTSLSTSLWSI